MWSLAVPVGRQSTKMAVESPRKDRVLGIKQIMEAILISPTPSRSNHSAARAFARIGWPKVWARLLRYATGTLGLAAIDARRGRVFEAADLVSTLVMSALGGTLDWTLPEDATDEKIMRCACTKLYGMRSTLRRRAARTVYDDALDERPDPCADALARLVEARGHEALERLFERDAEASAHLEEMLERKTRLEIADKLGCTLVHVDTVRKRIVRGIVAYARRTNDEDEPPSSGPRGTPALHALGRRSIPTEPTGSRGRWCRRARGGS